MKARFLIGPAFVLASLLVAATTLPLPYAYYTVLRWVVCAGALAFAIAGDKCRQGWAVFVFYAIAILFNPLWPIHMHRGEWRVADLLAAGAFLVGGIVFTRPDTGKMEV